MSDEKQKVDSTSDGRTANNAMRHQYRILSEEEKAQMMAIKDAAQALYDTIASVGKSRELSLALTKTQEACMWAVNHVTK